LVKAIEKGESDLVIEDIIRKALEKQNQFDTLVLGCTQFPFAEDSFRKIVGEKVSIFNPAMSVAQKVKKDFSVEGKGNVRFILSKDSTFFRKVVSKEFPESKIEII